MAHHIDHPQQFIESRSARAFLMRDVRDETPRILVCQYNINDPRDDRTKFVPVFATFAWGGSEPFDDPPMPPQVFADMQELTDVLESISAALVADAYLLASEDDGVLEQIVRGHSEGPGAWILVVGSWSVGEDWGGVPPFSELCELYQYSSRSGRP